MYALVNRPGLFCVRRGEQSLDPLGSRSNPACGESFMLCGISQMDGLPVKPEASSNRSSLAESQLVAHGDMLDDRANSNDAWAFLHTVNGEEQVIVEVDDIQPVTPWMRSNVLRALGRRVLLPLCCWTSTQERPRRVRSTHTLPRGTSQNRPCRTCPLQPTPTPRIARWIERLNDKPWGVSWVFCIYTLYNVVDVMSIRATVAIPAAPPPARASCHNRSDIPRKQPLALSTHF